MISFNEPVFDHGRRSRVPAGASTLREYEALRKAWIGRNRRVFRIVDGVVGLVVVSSVVVSRLLPWAGWYAGLLAGAALCFDLAVRMNPPAWIQHWQAGGIGEQRTGRALEGLSQRWTVIHDWQLAGRGNVDHVVIGPGGVFALETKNIGAPVRVDADTMTVSRPDGRRRYARNGAAAQARGNAAAISDELRAAGMRCWVHAVVVVWGEFDQRVVDGDRVVTVDGDHLTEWLESRPVRLDRSRVIAAQQHLSRTTATRADVSR